MNVLATLNSQQRQAVAITDGPVLISAGPGTGKTKTLTVRMAYALQKGLARPNDMVALTFTNKAAREMRERLTSFLGGAVKLPAIMTFHGLGADILRRSGSTHQLIGDDERQDILRSLPQPRQARRMGIQELGKRISHAKTSLAAPADTVIMELLAMYDQILQSRNVQDFDGLLRVAYDLQSSGQAPTYAQILVDEFQDTSELQYEMLKLLAPTRSIFAIGDPNQSIYAFRGAGAAMFAYFIRDYPEVRHVALVDNYRSCREIVAVSNALFPNSPQLIPTIKEPGVVRIVRTLNEYSEAAYILATVEAGIGGSDLLKATSSEYVRQPREFAVVYRTHRVARTVQRLFSEAGIPYQIVGEGSPYEHPDLQAVIAGLRYLYDPFQATLPQRTGLSDRQIQVLLGGISHTDVVAVCDMAAQIATALGIEFGEGIRQLQSTLVQFGTGTVGLSAALAHLADISASEFYDPSVNAVTLLTIHAAKGLEFGHVFIVAAEEGILPKLSKKQQDNDIAEEQRLFYVAVTRAKDTLEIVHAKFRGTILVTPSRFLQGIPEALLPRIDDPNLLVLEQRHKKRAAQRSQISLF